MSATDNFRRNLHRIRQERGLDAANLSKAAGLNKRAVTDIESGASKNPTLRSAVALARALNVSLLDLIGEAPAHDLIQEWREFLAQYEEEDQRMLLRAVESLRGPASE